MIVIRREGKPPLTLKSGGEPYELLILSACLLWSIAALTGITNIPSNSTKSIPVWGVYAFFAFLGLGSTAALAGVAAERLFARIEGFYLEAGAQCALVGLSLGYSIWAATSTGRPALSFVLLLGVIWGGGGWRIWRITRDLRGPKEPST